VRALLAASPPDGPAYDLVLLAHIGCAVIGFATVVVSGVQAHRLLEVPEGATPAPSLTSYYAPSTNWAGRVLYGVPVFGFLLLAMSDRAFSLADGWIQACLALWVVAIGLAEWLLWPDERRLALALAPVGPAPARGTAPPADPAAPPSVRDLCRRVRLVAAVLVVLFAVAVVLMVAQP